MKSSITNRDRAIFGVAVIVAGLAVGVVFNSLDNLPKTSTSKSAPVDNPMDFTDECKTMLEETYSPLEYMFRVEHEWWKDGRKVYVFNRWDRKGERDTRLCIVDIDKGFLFSPPAISQHQYY